MSALLPNLLELIAGGLLTVGTGLTFGIGPGLIVAGVCVGVVAFAVGRDEA